MDQALFENTLKYFSFGSAAAHPNIALVKYWGKRDARLNLPAAGSLSLTLSGLETRTTVSFVEGQTGDEIVLNEQQVEGAAATRISAFLDLLRERAGVKLGAYVETHNDFPTSAGLASSASGFAALSIAAAHALGLKLSPRELSMVARQGSGSAARSIFGGFVQMHAGRRDDGADAFAEPLAGPEHWDLRCLVAVSADGEKPIGSTDAMNHTAMTSPYYSAWIDEVPRAMTAARAAVRARDFEALATIAEASCLRMHASALAADPGILYWRGTTVELMHVVREQRAGGKPVFFTIDAGPHVKVFTTPEHEAHVSNLLRSVPGVREVLHTRPGPGARLISETRF